MENVHILVIECLKALNYFPEERKSKISQEFYIVAQK